MKEPFHAAILGDEHANLLYEVTSIVREKTGMNEEFASLLADAIVRGMSARWGGERVYIPVAEKASRNAAIRAAFNGKNLEELCKRFQISRSALYKILSQ